MPSNVKPDILGLTASIITWGIKQFKGRGVKEVITGTHLRNKEGVEPYLLKEHKTATGKDYVFSLPAGVDKSDFEKNRHYFESYTNSVVEIVTSGRKLILKTHKTNFSKEIKFSFDPTLYPKMIMPFPVGMTPDGKMIVEDMYRLPHMMCGGMTGYGKTSYLIGVMVAVLLAGAKVSVIDRKGVDFPDLAPWCNLALTEKETEDLLHRHVREMQRRQVILREAHCRNFEQYRKKHSDLDYMVLFVDELTQIENKACFKAIGDMAVLSRVSGISMILATQKPGSRIWDGFTDVRSQLSGAMCFHVRDQIDSQVVLGSGNTRGAELPKIPGRGIWNNEDDVMVQTMYLEVDEAIALLHERVPKGVYEFASKQCPQGIDT
jgi:S-DNA-T family DNA segregation ATPase FtsK/SpoIIIE